MRTHFPLFSSHLDLAHLFWEKLLCQGDLVVDATCGNGKDTLMLASLLEKKGGGFLIGLDIQPKALSETQKILEEKCPTFLPFVNLFLQSHETFPPLPFSPKLIVYNLGYLPGGDKSITTHSDSTLISLESAMTLLCQGGVLSITCYPGHLEGKREWSLLDSRLSSLDPMEWSYSSISWSNRSNSPILLFLQKKIH